MDDIVEVINALGLDEDEEKNLKTILNDNFENNVKEFKNMVIIFDNNNYGAGFVGNSYFNKNSYLDTYKEKIQQSYKKMFEIDGFVSANSNPFNKHGEGTLIQPFTTDEEERDIEDRLQNQLQKIESRESGQEKFLKNFINDLLSSKTSNPGINALILPKLGKELKQGQTGSKENNINFIENLVSTLNEQADMDINLEYGEERALEFLSRNSASNFLATSYDSQVENYIEDELKIEGLSAQEFRKIFKSISQDGLEDDEALVTIKKEIEDGNDVVNNYNITQKEISDYKGKGR